MSEADNSDSKLAIVIDSTLPAGLVANTAAVLAMTLGSRLDSYVGPDLKDGDGSPHLGITTLPIPVLVAGQDTVKQIRRRALTLPPDGMLVVDFTDCAQQSHHYDHYASRLAVATEAELTYLGIGLFGPRKPIQKLTGNLRLLR